MAEQDVGLHGDPVTVYVPKYMNRMVYAFGLKFRRWSSAFPVKSLVDPSGSQQTECGPQARVSTPWWFTIGPAGTDILSQDKRRPVAKVIKYLHHGIYEKALGWGFNSPCLRREFGGFGLPPMNQR